MPPRPRKSTKLGQHPADPTQETTSSRADASTSGPADAQTTAPADASDVHAVLKPARDRAYAWASAQRKLTTRTSSWADAIDRARAGGAPPGVLREQIREAAWAARIPVEDVPSEVWHAAGLQTPS